MVTRIFQALLFLSPICVGTNINMDMFDITFFRTGIIALFMASLFDKPRREIPQELVLIMISFLGLVFANVFIHTFSPVGLHTSFNLFLAVLGFTIVYTRYNETKGIRNYILAAAALNLVFFIIQKRGFDPVWNVHPFAGQEGALIGNQPRMITYFALVTSFCPLLFVPISFALGIITKQFTIFIPIAVMLFMRMKDKARFLYIMALILGLFLIRQHIYDSLAYRFNLAWAPALKIFFKQPLIGLGIGERPFPELGVVGSSYLQFIFGVGVLAVAWYWFAAKQLQKIRPQGDIAPMASFLLVCAIEYPVETPRMWYLIMGIILCFLLKLQKGKVSNGQTEIRS